MESSSQPLPPIEAPDWIAGFPGSVIVCDQNGTALYLNEIAAESYAASGGQALVGTNLLDCHPETARARFQALLDSQQANIYTTEKQGVKKLIVQSPWYRDGEYAGIIELNLEIPGGEMPHFIRD